MSLRYGVRVDVGEGVMALGPIFGNGTGSKQLFMDFVADGGASDLDILGAKAGASVWGKSPFFDAVGYYATGQSLAALGAFGAEVAGSGLASADLNGDGYVDVDVVVVTHDLNAKNTVWLNTANGGSRLERNGDLSARIHLPRATDVALGDLDNDGDPDMVITSDTVGFAFPGSRIYLNNGLGQFTSTSAAQAQTALDLFFLPTFVDGFSFTKVAFLPMRLRR